MRNIDPFPQSSRLIVYIELQMFLHDESVREMDRRGIKEISTKPTP